MLIESGEASPSRSMGETSDCLHAMRRLLGRNAWSIGTALEVEIELGDLLSSSTAQRELNHLTAAWHEKPAYVPIVIAETDERAAALAGLAAALQRLAWRPVPAASVRAIPGMHSYLIGLPCEEFLLAEESFRAAIRVCERLTRGQATLLDEELGNLRDLAESSCLGPSSHAIIAAARARGIAVYRLADSSLAQLGQGARQRRIQTAVSDGTSVIAESIAKDKELTRRILHRVGVPVPLGRPVSDKNDAWQAANEVGLPVVVKPRDGNHSRGVSLNLNTRAQIDEAFPLAEAEGPVMVERYVSGREHRILVVGGRMVAAARREPAQIEGDGQHSIQQLVENCNRDPARSDFVLAPLRRLPVDDVAETVLLEQGYTWTSIPACAEKVFLRRNTNLSRGGTAVDVTATVHPAVAARAIEAALAVGLDIAGMDIVAHDLTRPLEDQGGAVIEVNAGPGLTMHLDPWPAAADVGKAIVDHLFPKLDSTARTPIVAVQGAGAAIACERIAESLGELGRCIGLASRSGVRIGERKIPATGARVPEHLQQLMMHPQVAAVVYEVVEQDVREIGLGCDFFDVFVQLPSALPAGTAAARIDPAAAETIIAAATLPRCQTFGCKHVGLPVETLLLIRDCVAIRTNES